MILNKKKNTEIGSNPDALEYWLVLFHIHKGVEEEISVCCSDFPMKGGVLHAMESLLKWDHIGEGLNIRGITSKAEFGKQ